MKKFFFSLIVTILIFNVSLAQTNCDGLVLSGKGSKWENIDPLKAASLHNVYIEQAVKSSLNDLKKSDKEILLSLNILNVSKDYLNCLVDKLSKTSDLDMDKVIVSNLSESTAQNIYYRILEALSGDKSLSDISKSISPIRTDISNLKTQKDKDILLTCLETGLASAKFWLSKEKGGDGLGYLYTQTAGVNKANGDTRFKKDMRGAGYGMVCWSFSAFLGPVGAAGLVYGAVSGALVSSFLP